MPDNQIVPFAFEGVNVRTLSIDGEPWFVAVDVAAVLGIQNARMAVARIPEDDVSLADVTDSLGRKQQTYIVNEAGLYDLIFRSDKPEAKRFRAWITQDVLPEIRRTGGYQARSELDATTPEGAALVLQAALTFQAQVRQLTAKAAENAPKVEYVDRYVADTDLRILRNVAKSIGVAETTLRDALLDHNWIYSETSRRWSASKNEYEERHRYSAYADKADYFHPVPVHDAPSFKGEVMHTLKVTPMGAVAIARAAQSWGLAPALRAVVAS